MIRILLILLLFSSCAKGQVLVLGAIVDTTTPPPVDTTNVTGINFAGKTVIILGDSYVAGAGASPTGNRWSSLFCAGRSATEGSAGIPGQTMQTPMVCGPAFDPSTSIPTYSSGTHSALIIALGINDIGWNVAGQTPAAFKIDYQAAMTIATTTKGWPANKIILINSYKPFSFNYYVGSCGAIVADLTRIAAYNTAVQEVATEFGTWYVDMFTAMTGLDATYFDVDQLHPNNAGHAFIANYLINYL